MRALRWTSGRTRTCRSRGVVAFCQRGVSGSSERCRFRERPRCARRSCGKFRAEMPTQVREGSRLFRSELRKELVVRCQLAFPEIALQAHHLPEALRAEVETPPVEIAIFGLQPERRLHSVRALAAAIHDPFQHAHVLAEAGPHEFTVLVGAEPVDGEYFGRPSDRTAHREPVPEVVADVIAA